MQSNKWASSLPYFYYNPQKDDVFGVMLWKHDYDSAICATTFAEEVMSFVDSTTKRYTTHRGDMISDKILPEEIPREYQLDLRDKLKAHLDKDGLDLIQANIVARALQRLEEAIGSI